MRGDVVLGLCTRNGARFIDRAIDAVERLDRTSMTRMVVVDNGSTDETPDLLRRRGLPWLHVVEEPEAGKVNALIRLFHETDEPFVALIDDDCVPDQGWLDTLRRAIDAHPSCGIAGGPIRIRWEEPPTVLARKYELSLGAQDFGPTERDLQAGEFFGGGSMLVRREAIEASGWLHDQTLDCRRDEVLEAGEDAELCYLVERAGWGLRYVPDATLEHIIPVERMRIGSLARLRESQCRCEPVLRMLLHDGPHQGWARRELRRARNRWVKTLLTDWRPTRRRIRLAERAGRVRGWMALLDRLESGAPLTIGALRREIGEDPTNRASETRGPTL